VERGGRTLFALIVVGIALFGVVPSASSSDLIGVGTVGTVSTLSVQEQSLLAAINAARTTRGIPPLRIGLRLQRAADAHSTAMARSGSFTHGNWYRRLRAHGVRGRTLGETIAWGVGTDGTAQAIVAMWLASPSHRETMLRPGFRRVGVGIAIGRMSGYPGASIATADFSGG
jgi:uncharacterized protein YkwD